MIFFQAEMSNFIGLICGLVMLLTAAQAYVMARDDKMINWKPIALFWLLCGAVSWLGLFKQLDPTPLNIYLHQAEVLLYMIAYAEIIYFTIELISLRQVPYFKRIIVISLIAVSMYYLYSISGKNTVCLITGITMVSAEFILLRILQKETCPGKKYIYPNIASIILCGLLISASGTTVFPNLSLKAILTGTATIQLIAMSLYHRKVEYHLFPAEKNKYSLAKLIVFLVISIIVCGLFLRNEINKKKIALSNHLEIITSKISRNRYITANLRNAISHKEDLSQLKLLTSQMLNGLGCQWQFFFYIKMDSQKIQRVVLTQNNKNSRLVRANGCIPIILTKNHSNKTTSYRFYPYIHYRQWEYAAAISSIRSYQHDNNKYWCVLTVPRKCYRQTIANAGIPVLIGTAFFVGLTLVFWIIFDKYSILTHKLREIAARYSGLIEIQNDIIIRFSSDFRLTYANDVFSKQCGMSRKKLSGMSFDEIFDLARLKQWIQTSGEPARVEKLVLKHRWANENNWFEWQITPISDNKDQIIEYQGVGRNISELRSVINALRESEKKYRSLVDMAREGIVTIGSNAEITFANQQMEKMLGVEPESLKGQPILYYVTESNHKTAWKKLINSAEGQEEYSELVFRRKDGKKVYTHIAVTPLSSDCGENSGVMAVIVDISHFRQLENDLKKANGELENALNLSHMILNTDPNMIYVKKRNGETVMFNQAVTKFLGLDYSRYKVSEIDKLINDYCPENRFKETDQYVFETMKPYEFDEQVTTTLGSSFWLHTVKTPFNLPDGNIGILGITTDITSRKHAELVLEDSNKLLETKVIRRTNSLNKTIRELSREIREKQELQQLLQKESDRIQERLGQDLHDILGQTLTAISIKASILSNMLDTPEQKAEANHIIEYTGRAITQMRNISKTLSYVNVKKIGFESGMDDFIDFMSNVNQVNISLDINSNIITRLGEESQNNLFRIAQESIINAVKHGKAQNIELAIAESSTNHGTLSVTSDGQGLVESSDQTSKGIGLLIMQTRAAVMGASLKLVKNCNGCLNVFCCFPLPEHISSRRI